MIKIQEMPWVQTSDNSKDNFDLQIEDKSAKEILDFFKEVFSGKKFKDKYGDEILLSSESDKRKFASIIRSNKLYYGMILSKLSKQQTDELNDILGY